MSFQFAHVPKRNVDRVGDTILEILVVIHRIIRSSSLEVGLHARRPRGSSIQKACVSSHRSLKWSQFGHHHGLVIHFAVLHLVGRRGR